MSSFCFCRRLLALLCFAILSFASSLAEVPMRITFRTVRESLIAVPIMINGVGPFDFLLDTGSTVSSVDRKLAEELELPPSGRLIVKTSQGEVVRPLAHANSVMMSDAYLAGLDLLIVGPLPLPEVRGVLGEDFLRKFDIYIDYRHQLIQFDLGPGSMGEMLAGEHLPFTRYGSEREMLDLDRLVIVGKFSEFSNRDATLQLDSGTQHLILCSKIGNLIPSAEPHFFAVRDLVGRVFAAYPETVHLRLGKFSDEVIVFVPLQNDHSLNVDGLLPTSLFQSIFISHSGRFVILNPSVKPALTKEKPPSHIRAKADISAAEQPSHVASAASSARTRSIVAR